MLFVSDSWLVQEDFGDCMGTQKLKGTYKGIKKVQTTPHRIRQADTPSLYTVASSVREGLKRTQ